MRYHGNVWRYYLFRSLADIMLWMPIWVIYLQGHGFTLAKIGLLGAWELFIMTVSDVPGGALADRVGRARTLAIGSTLIAVGGIVYVVAADLRSFLLLMIGEIPAMAGATFLTGCNEALLYDSLQADEQSAAFNKTNSHAMVIVQAAQAVGSVAGGFLFATVAESSPFIITAVLALIAAGLALTFREPPRADDEKESGGLPYRQILKKAIRVVATRPVVRYAVLSRALVQIAPFVAVFILLQPYARKAGIPTAGFGIMFMIMRAGTMVGTHLGGRLRSSSSRVFTWLLVAQLAGIGALVIPVLTTSWVGVAGICVIAAAGGIQAPLLSTTLNHNITSSVRATVLSVQSMLTTLLMMVAQPSVGFVTDTWGYSAGFASLAAFPVVAAVPLILLVRHLRAPKQDDDDTHAQRQSAAL